MATNIVKISLMMSVLTVILSQSMELEQKEWNENSIPFERETIVDAEGYWAASNNPALDHYKGKYPFPKAHDKPWPGQKEFLEKLKKMELFARDHDFENPQSQRNIVTRLSARGFAPSRLESNVTLGNSEFMVEDINSKRIIWTDVLREYYIGKFNVIPSRDFYRFVKAFEIKTAIKVSPGLMIPQVVPASGKTIREYGVDVEILQ